MNEISRKRSVYRRHSLKSFKLPRSVSAGHGHVHRKVFQLNAKALIHLAADRQLLAKKAGQIGGKFIFKEIMS
jgi:hypothetical protein